MPIASVANLVVALRQSRLLSPAQIDEVVRDLQARFQEPKSLARELLQRGWLTAFQINQLFQGSAQDLVLGQYVLLERLSETAMGQVFKARHQHMKHTVALHIIRRELLTDPEAVNRFYQEVQAASQLTHPNVLHALDAGPVGRTHFFAVEYVAGIDLEHWVQKSGFLPIDQACDFICQAAQGLEHAYIRGLLHHDLRPANLLVTGTQDVVGTEREARPGQAQPAPESGMGTRVRVCNLGLTLFRPRRVQRCPPRPPRSEDSEAAVADFLAPELASPVGRQDVCSNMYSLGCTFYFLLTGHVPFPGGSVETKLQRHLAEEPAPIEVVRPDTPPRVAAVVRKLMAKRPEDRFQAPAEVVAALTDEMVPSSTPALTSIPCTSPPEAAEALLPTDDGSQFQTPIPSVVDTLVTANDPATQWDALLTPPLSQGALDSSTQVRKAVDSRRWLLGLLGGSLFLLIGAGLVLYLLLQQEKKPLASRTQATVQIDASKPWQDTGVDVPAGASLTISFSDGRWMKKGHPPGCTAHGRDDLDRDRAVAPEAPLLCLLGRVGSDEPPFAVGTLLTVQAKTGGRLFLQANDLDLQQNTGTLIVEIVGGRHSDEPVASPAPTRIEAAEAALRNLAAEATKLRGDRQQLRAEVLDFCLRYAGTAQAVRAQGLLFDLPSPLDRLEAAKLPAAVRAAAGGGDPAQAPAGLVAVLGDSRLTHWREVTAVAFSPDGKTLVSGSEDGTLKVWDVATGQVLRTLAGHGGGVTSLALSTDGKLLASGSWDRTVRLWETASGKLLRTLDHPQGVLTVALGHGSRFLASGCADNLVRLWYVAKAREPALPMLGAITVGVGGWPVGQGPLLAASLVHGRVPEERALAGHSRWVAAVAFRPDGQVLASGSHDGTVRLWDVASAALLRTLPSMGQTREVDGLAFSPDGKLLAASNRDWLRLWDPAGGQEVRSIHQDGREVRPVAFAPDGKTLAVGWTDGWVRLFEVATAKEVRAMGLHRGCVNAVAFHPGGNVLVSGSVDTTLKLWESATGRELLPRTGHAGQVNGLAFSPDTQLLATGAEDNTVRLWEVASGKELPIVLNLPDMVFAVTFRPDGKVLASSTRGLMKLWDPTTGKEVGSLGGNQDLIGSVAFSPDGRLLASGSNDRTARLWDAATGKNVRIFGTFDREVPSVAFASDGRQLAAASLDGKVRLWETATGKELRTLKHPREVQCIAIRPDGKMLASGSYDNAIHLWSLTSGRELLTLNGHQAVVTSVAFRPDGRVLASAARDGTVRLWDPDTGAERAVHHIGPLLGWVHRLAFSPDGRYLTTANGNGTVYVLRLAPPPLQAAR
jgi:WD40 repeat protein/serine/threonine protein kinase